MADSNSAGHPNRSKRSKNAFTIYGPFSPPLEHDGAESHEANPGGHHDHVHVPKKHKLNPEAPSLETTTNFPTSSPLPKQNIGTSGALDLSSPSNSIKHSANSGPSPQSIGSKSSHIEYVEIDREVGKTVSASQCYWNSKEDHNEMESVVSMAAEELSKRPKTGGIYKAIAGHRDCTVKRLKELSNKEPTIDVGLEMADAAYLLKLMSSSTKEIEMAGQKGHKGAMLLLQAEILRKRGQELIAECQNQLRDTL